MSSFPDANRVAGGAHANESLTHLNLINREVGIRGLRFATGKRINSAQEDSAGFVIGRALQARSRGLAMALNNIGDARSMLSVAEGGFENILDILETMKEKATRAASGTLGDEGREALKNDLHALAGEIDDIVAETTFNGLSLLSGTSLNIQTGAETTDSLAVEVSATSQEAADLGVSANDLDVSSSNSAASSLSSIDSALASVRSSVASVGSNLTRLSSKESTLVSTLTNSEAARSRIIDANFAREQLEFSKNRIKQDAASAALAQSNASDQAVLALVG